MKDWGMLAKDFPKIKPMKVKKVSTPKKISIPAVRKHTPVKPPKRRSKQQAADQNSGSSLSEKEAESIRECNKEAEDQREAEKLSRYLHKEFPDVLKEQLKRDDRMDVDPA